MSGEQPVQVRLSGVRELAIDGVRHFAALVAATGGAIVAMTGGEALVPTAQSLRGWGAIVGALAVVTLLGHVLVTRIRGVVSLPASAFFTWAALVAVASTTMLGTDRDAFLSNFWLSAMVSVPAIVLATALRAFIPPFRTVPGTPYDQESALSVAQSDR